MTVKELIEALQQLPPDLPVLAEGCDCDGVVGSVTTLSLNDWSGGVWKEALYAYLNREAVSF